MNAKHSSLPNRQRETNKTEATPAGFSRRVVVVRDAHLAELLDLQARHGIQLITSVDEAIRSYLENRLREALSNFHGT